MTRRASKRRCVIYCYASPDNVFLPFIELPPPPPLQGTTVDVEGQNVWKVEEVADDRLIITIT